MGKKLGIVAIVLVGLFGVAVLGGAYWQSNVLLTPTDPLSAFPYEVLDTDGETEVTLVWDTDTDLAGKHALFWETGHAFLGEQIDRQGEVNDGEITYEIMEVTRGDLTTGENVIWHQWYFDGIGDPTTERGLEFETVAPVSDVGELPSWYLEGDSDTWVIVVHGIDQDHGESLRMLPTLVDTGAHVLVIRYRNDPGIPSEDGLLHLGDTEWQDVEAAMEYGLDNGAEKFVLYGISYGTAVSWQALDRSAYKDRIVGMVADSPVVAWQSTLNFQAGLLGVPTFLANVVGWIADIRIDTSMEQFDWIKRADELDVPHMIFHGPQDNYVPFEPSEQLAELRPDIVTLVQIDNAGHTRGWNTETERYETELKDYIEMLLDAEVPAAA